MIEPISHSAWLIPAVKEAYKSREQIASNWERIVTQIKGKKIEIAVTGLSGAGKTVLLDHLTGQAYHRGYAPPERSRSSETGKMPAKGFRIGLSTIPGQDSRIRQTAIAKIFETKRPVDGVIHVVSNGYIIEREAAAREVLAEDLHVATIEQLRQHFLEEELRDLEATLGLLRSSLRKSHKPKWLIVAVAKSDLFYDRILEAERYYSPSGRSAFTEKMRQFLGQVGSDNFGWEAAPVATWIEDFHWGNETLTSQLKPDQCDHFVGKFAEILEKYCGS
ncbi:MAG: GTPase [Janthinobacterium lividum]